MPNPNSLYSFSYAPYTYLAPRPGKEPVRIVIDRPRFNDPFSLELDATRVNRVHGDCLRENYAPAYNVGKKFGERRARYKSTLAARKETLAQFSKNFWLIARVAQGGKTIGPVVGFMEVQNLPAARKKSLLLNGIYLAQDFRGIGLAQELLFELLRIAMPNEIRLYVAPYNTPAVKFYDELGFKPVGNVQTQIWGGQELPLQEMVLSGAELFDADDVCARKILDKKKGAKLALTSGSRFQANA